MASILLLLLIAVFVVIFILLSLGTYILSTLLGGFMNLKNFICRLMGWNINGKTQTNTANSSFDKTSSHASSTDTKNNRRPSQGKMFDQDEGTYIDFEEVKYKDADK